MGLDKGALLAPGQLLSPDTLCTLLRRPVGEVLLPSKASGGL